MSRISEKIREILKLADSSKITDKRKCVTDLLDVYHNDDALKEVCQNTERKTGIVSWSHIMHVAHKLVLDEAERGGKETNIKNNERQAIMSLVINTIRHSNEKSTELLKSSEVIPMILQILDSKIYIHYQDAYLGILVTYILSKSTNHSNIAAEQWKELLTVCLKLYRRAHLKKHVVLDALQMIVEHSFLHTNLLVHVKNLLLFLEKIFEDVKGNNEQLTESFYKLSNSVCRQIAMESRVTLCKFSEDIALDILRLNGSEEKYRLLLIFLQIHHPHGTSKYDDGAYAYDTSKWRDLLRSMCLVIQENCKLDVQWRSFVEFASEVIKQVVDNTVNLGCSLEANFEGTHVQNKRRRILNRMENVVELITESSPEEVWSMLKILTETLRKYPQCLKPQELAPLLQRLTELAQSRDESIMNNLYNLAAVLMENEVSSGEEMQDATIHWSKIWDMLLSNNKKINEIKTQKKLKRQKKIEITKKIFRYLCMSVLTMNRVLTHLQKIVRGKGTHSNRFSFHFLATLFKQFCYKRSIQVIFRVFVRHIGSAILHFEYLISDSDSRNAKRTRQFRDCLPPKYLYKTKQKNTCSLISFPLEVLIDFTSIRSKLIFCSKKLVTLGVVHPLIFTPLPTYLFFSFKERRRRSDVCTELPSSTTTTSLPRKDAIRLRVVEALAAFCALHIGADCDKSTLQTRMMKNLLIMQQDFTSSVDTRMSLTILESLATRDQAEIQCQFADKPLELLSEVCQKCRKNEESTCRLLNLLPYFFKYATEYSYSPKETLIKTLGAFYNHIHQRNCGVLVHVNYMKCICNFVRIDPDFLWSSSNNEVASMLDSVLDYIGNKLFLLRSQAIRCLQELLSFGSVADEWKEWMFVIVEKTVFKLFDEMNQQSSSNSENLEENQQEDEKETRTATALIALTSVACASSILQGRALHAILRLTVEKKLSTQKVQKVLLAAAQHTTTHVSLVEDNLSYLLTTWISDAQYPLESFPWTLAGCESMNEFFRKHVSHIVPILLRTSNLAVAVSFCANCAGVAFDDVFEDVFPSCFAWLISSDESTLEAGNKAERMLWDLLKSTNKFEKTRGYGRLFSDRLQDVLVELVRRLHDEDDFKRVLSLPGVRFPAMDPPHFPRATVDRCLDRLERNFLGKPLTLILVEQQPAALQKTLLCLVSAVHSSRSREGQLKRLHQYAYFCSRLNLAEPFFDEMAAFLIRDVCYSLLHLTRNSDETLVTACCKFLDMFLRSVLPTRAAEVRDILRFIVASLIRLAQGANDAGNVAANLLRFLVVEQKDTLREAIAKLSAFPNHEIFRDARETHNIIRSKKDGVALCLEDELERFLGAINEENAECTLEDLADLTQQLSTRKRELRELHQKLGTPGYPEDGASILHRLVFKLVKLMESSNSCISMEATKCLGELGPMDSTVVLRPIKNLIQEADHAIEALTYHSVSMLTSFLVENAVELRKVSADALYAVLSTSHGRKLSNPEYLRNLSNILKEYAPLKIDYIQPFSRGRCVTQTSFHVDNTKFRIVMDPKNALWTVKDSMNYTEWVVKITCGIAECFADSYLESFLPVCRLSIEFCELILPRIIYLIICENKSFIGSICDCVNHFFRHHFAINQETEATSRDCDQKIVRRMLDVVNHIRAQLPDGASLKLDYVHLAKAAHKCSAYYTALLFAQLACESISTDYPDFSSDPRIDYIYERQPEDGRVLQDIMLDTYTNISDPDAIYGAGSSHLLDHESRIQYYARTNRWDNVMLAQDIELSHNGNQLTNAKTAMANALHHSGLQFLQWQFLGSDCLDEKFSYECAWRLSNWNLLISDNVNANCYDSQAQPRLEQLENAFHAHHYHALKCLHENDRQGTERAIESARESVIRSLRIISLESNRTGAFPVAARALGSLTKQGNLSVDLQNQLLYQESLLTWMKSDQIIARRLLRTLIEKRKLKPSLRAKALRVYGDWMAETKSENPQAVIQKYYLESIETSEAIKDQVPDVVRNLHDTQVALARFADAQYEQITAYMNSPVYESLKEYAHGNDAMNKVDQVQKMKNHDLKRAMLINQRQTTNDAAELKNIGQERRKYLGQAVLYYLKTLQCSEEHNMLIFRLVALWLDNMLDEEVNELLLKELNTVPSFKFIPLVPQLAAHISNDLKQRGSFSAHIFEILERAALEHPYHTLPVLLALKNLHSDDEYDSAGKVTKKQEERRVLGAKKLLKQLANSPVSAIVHEMENLSRALLSLAYWQPNGKCYPGKCYPIPRDQPICKLKNLSNVLLPTLSLSVRPSGNYKDVIGVKMYQDTCEFVGGVNAPKKVICVGTDGVHRRQLVKGKDDLRQDAVMQQVFTVMNALLRTCKETKRRNLRIRTYKVVPLTQRSGVLEWCDNTVPITAALMGKPGLHKKYYPRDLTAEAAREKLKNVAQDTNEVKLKVFLECCKRMRPAFHHFFEEKYRSPETWVERTLTYTRSVATTSIAGYILGLGDRHLSNILIDERTAEVVHIDFGVAFEQGKVLPVPETIPFRLTRDIEVAMGVSGIEGTMRRSCEVTMTMLRDQRQIIITLLQVLLYDPLFTWAITPEKACKMQSDVVKRGFSENSGRAPVETNKIAKRALLRIEQKLRGTEDGLVSSVPGQVERLLQEARDPANLCRVYCGWQPYL
ncbi:Serine-protein kinase ATM [Ooceraea biroi]|uniref:Serine/threonine-protein kinase ATM n=1 Tax=Ooceraea biroi TaxID=2015173 RepID=A0A026WF86_OOCBI|nr:Serine-protein kinase ATM [Ooceraea biroi]